MTAELPCRDETDLVVYRKSPSFQETTLLTFTSHGFEKKKGLLPFALTILSWYINEGLIMGKTP